MRVRGIDLEILSCETFTHLLHPTHIFHPPTLFISLDLITADNSTFASSDTHHLVLLITYRVSIIIIIISSDCVSLVRLSDTDSKLKITFHPQHITVTMSQLTDKEHSLMTAMVKNFNGSFLASVSNLLPHSTSLPHRPCIPKHTSIPTLHL